MSRDLFNDPSIDWSSCTYKGARLRNHRDFLALSFAEKLEVIESLGDHAREVLERLKRTGRPYIDPYSKQRVNSDKFGE